jgi:hypothetical protein
VTFDPSEELHRLAAQYFGKSDEELVELAEDAPSLTDLAKSALQAEIDRRKLGFGLRELIVPTATDIPPNLIALRQFLNLPEALLAKSVLDSAGFESFLADANTIRMDWLLSNAIGGVKLLVRSTDASAADELLKQNTATEFDVEGDGTFTQPRCPHCNSLDVSYQGLNKTWAYGSIALGIPYPASHIAWKCDSCGQMWEDAPREEKSEPPPQT